MCLTQQPAESRITFDRQNTSPEGGKDSGVATKPRGGVDYRSITSTKQLREWMPTDGQSFKDRADPLPRPILGPAKFEAHGAFFQRDVR